MSTEELKKILNRIKDDKKIMLIIILGIAGMLLIMLSESGGEKAEINGRGDSEQIILSERELASDVERFIENIKGAGKAKVILTFESFEETVYAVDKDENVSSDGETDSSGQYVIIDNGSNEDGLKLKILSPKIRGVAVICKGGSSPVIKEQITTALSALFDISTNRISVAEMAD